MDKILTGLFLILIAGLLVAMCVGFEWAGGEGVIQTLPAQIEITSGSVIIEKNGKTRTANDHEYLARGEIVRTGGSARATIKIGKEIWTALDERTDISLEKLTPTQVELKITRGRILAQTSGESEKFTVSSPEDSKTITNGAITAVRYDWLEKTEIIPFNEFDWENSSEKDFYEWGLGLKNPRR